MMKLTLACVAATAVSLRTNKTRSRQNVTTDYGAPEQNASMQHADNSTDTVEKYVPPPGPPGVVESLYVYGAPELGKPALTSFGGCFKGRHVVAVRSSGDKQVDSVPVGFRQLGFQGAKIELEELDIGEGSEKFSCDAEEANRPSGKGKWGLHDHPEYYRLVEESGTTGNELDYAFFALHTAEEQSAADVKKGVERRGWRLVASASHPGGGALSGPQVAHLIQHPQSLDCVVTFQFTKFPHHWWKNLVGNTTSFCALPEGAEVHKSLAESLELMVVNSTEWQTKVRPNLSFCKRVVSVGHSQGAAEAELFAACINQHHASPPTGTYDAMRWTKLEPKQLPYL